MKLYKITIVYVNMWHDLDAPGDETYYEHCVGHAAAISLFEGFVSATKSGGVLDLAAEAFETDHGREVPKVDAFCVETIRLSAATMKGGSEANWNWETISEETFEPDWDKIL